MADETLWKASLAEPELWPAAGVEAVTVEVNVRSCMSRYINVCHQTIIFEFDLPIFFFLVSMIALVIKLPTEMTMLPTMLPFWLPTLLTD